MPRFLYGCEAPTSSTLEMLPMNGITGAKSPSRVMWGILGCSTGLIAWLAMVPSRKV